MKKIFLVGILGFLISGDASAQGVEQVNGYYRQNGTYVQPYMKTIPDGNPYNNFSTQGNVNPYTGAVGTVNPYNGR